MQNKNLIIVFMDSVSYDQFLDANAPTMKSIGSVHLALAHGSWTGPSFASLLLGEPPWCSVRDCEHNKILPRCINIFNEMKKKGYHIYGYTSSPWAKALEKRMKYYNYSESLEDMLTDFLETKKEPFFVIFHILETHMPYSFKGNIRETVWRDGKPVVELEKEAQLKAIEYVDIQIGKLMNEVEADFLITADHGDIFDERYYGHMWQDLSFCPELLKVPIIATGVI